MPADRKRLYLLSVISFAVLLIPLFLKITSSRIVAACLLLVLSLICPFLLKKRDILSIYRKEATLIISVSAVLAVVLLYLSGLKFGFYINPVLFNLDNVIKYLLPGFVIIVSSEVIRSVFLAGQARLPYILCYFTGVLSDILIHTSITGITRFNAFMDFVGLYMLPALAAGIAYQYIGKRHGKLPNIIFRSITALYIYVLPKVPRVPDALLTVFKILAPLFVYFFIRALYEKKTTFVSRKKKLITYISMGVFTTLLVAVMMVVSCQFHYCAVVIATESMTGEIDKGDALIYEKRDNEDVEIGQVIVFTKNKSTIIHRVVDIKHINGQTRYYTKGDANKTNDAGYITDSDIIGFARYKLPYLGYPTLWMRELFK